MSELEGAIMVPWSHYSRTKKSLVWTHTSGVVEPRSIRPNSPGPHWLRFLTLQEEADGGSGHPVFKTPWVRVPVDHEGYLES